MIEFQGLSFRYPGGGLPALRDISLRIPDGAVYLIIGESGSGKTTLAKVLSGFLGPEDGDMTGRVTIDGMDIHGVPRRNLVDLVGLVQQDPESQMVTLNVEDEVAFGLENRGMERGEMASRISWALQAAGAEGLAGRSIATLSGGELQKIAIASIIALRPRVLVLDEPTSSLDPPSAWKLEEVLGELSSKGITVVVIEHRYSWMAHISTGMAVLSEGQISAVCSPAMVERVSRRSPPSMSRVETPALKPILSLDRISFAYEGRMALRDVSLDIHAGEVIGVMGDNGSGKSTLLYIIMGLLKPCGGSIRFPDGGVRTTSLLARHVGMVFQNPNHQIFESTVNEEILFGPRNFGMPKQEAESRTNGMLEVIGLRSRRDSSPHLLSLGEKRRLNVGSVAVYDPDLYLLDEPFVGQDPANVERIMAIVRERVKRGASCMVVTHDPDFALQTCDRIAFLREARMFVQGVPSEVFSFLQKEGEGWYLPSGWSGP